MKKYPLFALALCLTSLLCAAKSRAYDPLAITSPADAAPRDLIARDAKRGRDIPLRVYLPADKKPAPVVLFSHGLGGSRGGCSYLGKHWSARGYVAIFLQHPGSDDSVWKDLPPADRRRAMTAAAGIPNFLLRVQDVPAALDQLALWQIEMGHALAGRLDLDRIGMSGHSFGAVTTQALSGQTVAQGGQRFTDARIRAAIVFSPSTPQRGTAAASFGAVQIPWLLMTGTLDSAEIGGKAFGNADLASRQGVFPALPPGAKYELVLDKATHYAFTDRADMGEEPIRNPNHHRAILALSTAFWDAHLRSDTAAKAWLTGDGPRTVLEEQDRWQKK